MIPSDAVLAAGVTELSFTDQQGRVVVVKLWSSCYWPCGINQPDLEVVHAPLPYNAVVLISVNIEVIEKSASLTVRVLPALPICVRFRQ